MGDAVQEGSAVSAVLATRDRLAHLPRCLDEVLATGVQEVVVVDDSSTDGTWRWLTARAATEPRLTVLQNPGPRGIAARAAGVRAAAHPLLLMLDDDSWPDPGALPLLVSHLESSPGTAVVGGLVRDVDATGAVAADHGPGTFDWWLRVPAPFFFPACGALARRDAVLAVGSWQDRYGHGGVLELDLALRLREAGWSVDYLPAASFTHMKAPVSRPDDGQMLALRVRNGRWYAYLNAPGPLPWARSLAPLLVDLVLGLVKGHPGAVTTGLRRAWTDRATVAGARSPVSVQTWRAVERPRARRHLELLAAQARAVIARRPSTTAAPPG